MGRPFALHPTWARALAWSLLTSLSLPALGNDPAAAESLFREAQKLLAQGETAHACEKLEESQRLDPTGATALSLGRCLESLGRTASAWARYQEALEYARKKGAKAREQEIAGRIAAVVKEVPMLVLRVSDAALRIPGLQVTRDGTLVGRAQYDTSIAVDPGVVRLTATAPGHETWSVDITLPPGKSATVALTDLKPLAPEVVAPPVSASASASAIPADSTPPTPPAPSALPPAETGAQRGLGYVALGGGVVGLGLGVYFLIRHKTLSDQATSLCASASCGKDNHDAALERSAEAGRAGTWSVVGFAGGAALSAFGVYWLTRSPDASTAWAPWVGAGVAGGTVEGRF